ncbi:MAG: MarR family transcriptional regulator [Solirubrobacterales bacterium]|nr:MarR family transcriptional regulator [Solirubrobacterales bacterium]MBV9838011.1 MarR family transcriptional regulator [Solirubrobacterales bacterium]
MTTVAPRRRDEPLDSPEPFARLMHSFKAAFGAVRRLRGRETHRPDQLSDAQYGLLFGLAERSELSASELAAVAELSPATVSEMLDPLVATGLVARVRSERDKRVVLISLTDRGRELVRQRRERFERRFREALGQFSDEQLLSAAAVLDRLRQMFDEPADADG